MDLPIDRLTGGTALRRVVRGPAVRRVERPAWRLVGFARVEVPADGTRAVEIPISLRTLAVRREGRWWMEPGRYAIRVARHAGDPGALRLDADVTGST